MTVIARYLVCRVGLSVAELELDQCCIMSPKISSVEEYLLDCDGKLDICYIVLYILGQSINIDGLPNVTSHRAGPVQVLGKEAAHI